MSFLNLALKILFFCSIVESGRRRGMNRIRPNCEVFDPISRRIGHPLFPLPFFARRGFRGFGIPDIIIDKRMGRPCAGPIVEPLTLGHFALSAETLRVSSGVDLVTDIKEGELCLVIVDTGVSTQRMEILRSLAAVGVTPEHITDVVLTHFDVDSVGNLNLFPNARLLVGNRQIHGDLTVFPNGSISYNENESGLPFVRICDNTFVYSTPGFGTEDLSVVVKNVSEFGTISLIGNLIGDQTEAQSKELLQRFSQNEEKRKIWEQSRKEVICLSDHLLPGYGYSFAVTDELRRLHNCPPAI